jgi:PHD/YefM family antitoxin component YafN of YafNO toxin-antitoxin module
MAGLTKEIGQNQDIINAYTSGNRLQQEAIAKSVGLQKDDIAKMIIDQKSQLGLTDEQVQKASGMNEEDFKRLSVQESINKSISKMGEALAGPLEMLASMAEHTGLMKVLFTGLATVITGVLLGGLVKSTLQLGTMLGLNLANAAAATATAEASTVGLATPLIIGGIALVMGAVMGAVGTAMAMKDGVIDPKKGPIVSGEFGTVQLNPNDQIVAGTDLAGDKKPKGGKSQPSMDITPMVQELQAVKAVLNQILAKDTTVKMDSNKVGQAHNVGAVKVQ